MDTEETFDRQFITFPANNGGLVLAKRSELAGGRPNEAGTILYLRSGPSLYVAASMTQIAKALGAEPAELRRE
ncbi:MAG: hypothetical protein U1E15_04475 [Hyphomicrobiales bacterium]